MPTIILLNHVHFDGMGDFSHLADLYQALAHNPKLRHYEFVPVVSAAPAQYEKVKKRLLQLNPSTYFFAADNQKLYQNTDLRRVLARAQQVMLISHADFPNLSEYQSCFHPKALLKFIGEHESPLSTSADLQKNGWIIRPLGLSNNCCGLKLTDEVRLQPEAALSLLAEEKDHPFLEALLQHSGSANIDHFVKENALIPAYFNKYGLLGFLHFLALNPALSPGKNLSVYLSGDCHFNEGFALLEKTQVKQLEIIQPDGQSKVVHPLNPSSDRIIRIFYGFHLTDHAYNAVYQQAPYAGVSGDNTFEKALSNKIFPFYHSTNFTMKRPSLLALAVIIKQLELPATIKADYIFYFQHLNLFSNTFLGMNNSKRKHVIMRFGLDPDQRLDFPAMIQAWPSIAGHLLKQYNFYDRLEGILLEATQPDSADTATFEEKEYNPAPLTRSFFPQLLQDEQESEEPALKTNGPASQAAFEATRNTVLAILNNYKKAWFKSQDRIDNVNHLIQAVQNTAVDYETLLPLLNQAGEDAKKDDARINRSRCCGFFTRNQTGSRYQTALTAARHLIPQQPLGPVVN